MDKSIAWRAFNMYLREKGCSEESKKGNPSTVYDYPNRIDRICKREGYSNWDDFGDHIFEIIKKYDENGCEAEYGKQSDGSNLNALKLFLEFYGCFDARKTI